MGLPLDETAFRDAAYNLRFKLFRSSKEATIFWSMVSDFFVISPPIFLSSSVGFAIVLAELLSVAPVSRSRLNKASSGGESPSNKAIVITLSANVQKTTVHTPIKHYSDRQMQTRL